MSEPVKCASKDAEYNVVRMRRRAGGAVVTRQGGECCCSARKGRRVFHLVGVHRQMGRGNRGWWDNNGNGVALWLQEMGRVVPSHPPVPPPVGGMQAAGSVRRHACVWGKRQGGAGWQARGGKQAGEGEAVGPHPPVWVIHS